MPVDDSTPSMRSLMLTWMISKLLFLAWIVVYTTCREDLVEAMDPGYFYINWKSVTPVPPARWDLPDEIKYTAIPNWPDCYRVDKLTTAAICAGFLKGKYPGVITFAFFQKLVIRQI